MKKLGRNEPCWCGSGKKYKKCHLNLEGNRPGINEINETLKKVFDKKYCFAPYSYKSKCSGDIVKAHSVTKSLSLKTIAQNGHVYGVYGNFGHLIKTNGRIQVCKIGINNASIFTGFCSYHDNELFKLIEGNSFNYTKEECLLHAYRALCMEYFKKDCINNDEIKKLLREVSPSEDYFSEITLMSEIGVSAGLNDLKLYKSEFDKMIISKNFSNLHSFIIKFKTVPTVMATGGMFPVYDFNGNLLKSKEELVDIDITPDTIYYNSFCVGGYGYFVASWLNNHKETCEKFINSLKIIRDDRMTDAIIRFLFSSCENIFISPEWWDTLDVSKKDTLVERINNNVISDYKEGYLMDDGLYYADWNIEEIVEL